MTDSILSLHHRSSAAILAVVLLMLGGFTSSPALAQNASFTISPTSTPYPGQTITVDGTSSTFNLGYVWYVDGTQVRSSPGADGGLTFDTTFASIGTKTIRLKVSSRNDDCDPIQDPNCDLVNSSSVSKTVAVENAAPTAQNANLETDEDEPGTVDLSDKVSDPNDSVSSLTISVVSGPDHGNTSVSGRSVTYAPNSNFNGSDHFDYQVSDGSKSSNTKTVSITVNPVDDPPTAKADDYSVQEDDVLNVSAPGVLENDTDVDDRLTASKMSEPSKGTVTSFENDGSFTFDPSGEFASLSSGSSKTVSFEYRATGGSESDTAPVSITVQGVNSAPVASADSGYTTVEDRTLRVTDPDNGLLANDQDPEGEELEVTRVTKAPQGTVTSLAKDGTFTYEPPKDMNGRDGFTYEVTDGEKTATATVNISIKRRPDISLGDGRSYDPSSPSPGTEANPIGRFQLAADETTPTGKKPVLTEVTIADGSSPDPSGIEALEMWMSSNETFAPSQDSLLRTKFYGTSDSFSDAATFTGLNVPIPTSGSIYVFVVVDLTNSPEGEFAPIIRNQTEISFADGDLSAINGSDGNSFSDAALSSTSAALPVELASFDGDRSGEVVHLRWTTVSETDNAAFRVQRRRGAPSRRGRRGNKRAGFKNQRTDVHKAAWNTIETVPGAGTTSESQSYEFTDTRAPYDADTLAYRLKQIDTDGSSSVTGPIVIGRAAESVELRSVAPNPSRSQVTVRFAVPRKEHTTIRLFDVLGREVRTVMSGPVQGRQKRAVDVSTLPSGLYLLRLRAGQTRKTERLTVVQ